MSADAKQIGGTHYKAAVQHWDFVHQCLRDRYMEGQVTKYITRWRLKHGTQDLEKAKHYLEKLIEMHHAGQIDPMRPPRALNFAACFREFASSNNMKPEEQQICWHISMWESLEDLVRAMEGIQFLINNAPVILEAAYEAGELQRPLRNLLPEDGEEPGCHYVRQD